MQRVPLAKKEVAVPSIAVVLLGWLAVSILVLFAFMIGAALGRRGAFEAGMKAERDMQRSSRAEPADLRIDRGLQRPSIRRM